MKQSTAQGILAKIGVAILAIALVDLVYLNYWILNQEKSKKEVNISRDSELKLDKSSPTPLASATLTSSGDLQQEESESSPSPAATKETSVGAQTVIQTAQKEIFIPIGSGSTKKNEFTDLSGLEVTVDTSKYSAIESAVFEASLWVQDGNGKVYAQLYDKTDSHPVWNSEISTSLSTATLTTSSKITLGSGSRTYKVQAKTNLTEFAAHVDNARIKITLR